MGNREFEIAARAAINNIAGIALDIENVVLVTAQERNRIFIGFNSNFVINYEISFEKERVSLEVRDSAGNICGSVSHSEINKIHESFCKYHIFQLLYAVGSKDISSIKDRLEKMR